MNRLILKYHVKLAAKRVAAGVLSLLPTPQLSTFPEVTIFCSNLNTRYPLEVTLESLRRCTQYPNYCLWIGDNASTDGSVEYLDALQLAAPNVRVTKSAVPRRHSHWLDDVFRTVTSTYWVAVDSDMLFLGRDWLTKLVAVMERDKGLYLLAAELLEGVQNGVEPASGQTVDSMTVPSSWLFCVRTSLRGQIDGSFGWLMEGQSEKTGNPIVYDTGAKLLSGMDRIGLRYASMPKWFTLLYHHFGSLSWIHEHRLQDAYGELKEYQAAHIKQLAQGGKC